MQSPAAESVTANTCYHHHHDPSHQPIASTVNETIAQSPYIGESTLNQQDYIRSTSTHPISISTSHQYQHIQSTFIYVTTINRSVRNKNIDRSKTSQIHRLDSKMMLTQKEIWIDCLHNFEKSAMQNHMGK